MKMHSNLARLSSSVMRVLAYAGLAILSAAVSATAQVPKKANLTRWDLYTVTAQPPAEGTHKLAGIARDASGNVWVAGLASGEGRLGRLSGNTYTEWDLFKYPDDGTGPTAVAVAPSGDVWVATSGMVPFVRKLAGQNSFIDYRLTSAPFAPRSLAVSANGATVYAAGADAYGRGAIFLVPAQTTAGTTVGVSGWSVETGAVPSFQPQYVALDANSKYVWFTNSGDASQPNTMSTVVRLDVTNGQFLSWPLDGRDAAGLSIVGSRVCVVSRGSVVKPADATHPAGQIECLTIPSTPASTPATRVRYVRNAAGDLYLPSQVTSNSAGQLMVTEQGNNAVVFVAAVPASSTVSESVLATAGTMVNVQLDSNGVAVQDDFEGPNAPMAGHEAVGVSPVNETLTSTDIGAGQARFVFPVEQQQNGLEDLTKRPNPDSITSVFYPDPQNPGFGVVYIAESFYDRVSAATLGARIDRFELVPPPVIQVKDAQGNAVAGLSFTAELGAAAATPASQTIEVSNGGPGTLPWTASAAATDFALAVSPASGSVSGTASNDLTVTPTVPAGAGVFNGSLTVSSTETLAPVTVPVTFTVSGPPLVRADRSTLAFTANRDQFPSQTVVISNAAARRPLTWVVSKPSWLTVTSSTQTVTGGSSVPVTIAVASYATLPLNQDVTGTVRFADSTGSTATGSIVEVQVTLRVTAPVIGVSASSVTLPAAPQGSTQTQVLQVTNTGTGPLTPSFAIAYSGPSTGWLSASYAGDTEIAAGEATPRNLTISADTRLLAAGTYSATLAVSDHPAADAEQSVAVTVTVQAAPVIRLQIGSPAAPVPSPLVLATNAGSTAQATIQIANPGTGTLAYTATIGSTPAFASIVSGATGSVAAGAASVPANVTMAFATAGLTPGQTYDAMLHVIAPDAVAADLPIRVKVKAGHLEVTCGSASPCAGIAKTAARGTTVTTTLQVRNSGEAPVTITSTVSGNSRSGGSWFQVIAPADVVLDPNETATFTVALDTSVAATYAGGAVVFAASAADNAVTVPVAFTVEGATLTPGGPVAFTWRNATGQNPVDGFDIDVKNDGSAPVTLAVTASAPWVQLALTPHPVDAQRWTLGVDINSAVAQSMASGAAAPAQVVVQDAATGLVLNSIVVNFTKIAAPRFSVTPGSLTFATARGVNPAAQTLVVANTGGDPLNFSIDTSSAPWLHVTSSPRDASGGATVTVTADVTGMVPGTYTGVIHLSDPNAEPASVDVPVTLTVRSGTLTVAPSSLAFTMTRFVTCNSDTTGANPAAQTLVVTNTTSSPFWYLAVTSDGYPSWLSVDDPLGVIAPGKSKTLNVSITGNTLVTGDYTAQITVYALSMPSQNPHSVATDNQVVPVTLKVSPAPPTLCVPTTTIDFDTLSQSTQSAARFIPVTNAGDGALTLSTSTQASSGVVTVVPVAGGLQVWVTTGTKKGAQTGQVVITAAGAARSQVVSLAWDVSSRKGAAHTPHSDGCHADHDGDGDHDSDDDRRHLPWQD